MAEAAVAHAPGVLSSDGASASVEEGRIVVRDKHGAEVFSYAEAEGLRITAPVGDLTLCAPQGRVIIEGAEAAVRVGRWEVAAQRIVESAVDSYRSFSGLAQTRAGRVRRIAKTTYELFAQRTMLSSEKDTSIEGERVLLG